MLTGSFASGCSDAWLAMPGLRRCENLEVHHKEFRSHLGSDAEDNLITSAIPVIQEYTARGSILARKTVLDMDGGHL